MPAAAKSLQHQLPYSQLHHTGSLGEWRHSVIVVPHTHTLTLAHTPRLQRPTRLTVSSNSFRFFSLGTGFGRVVIQEQRRWQRNGKCVRGGAEAGAVQGRLPAWFYQ
jgi:hypothetical protein